MKALAGQRRRLRENGVKIDGSGEIEHRENAERKAEIADAIDEKSLDRSGVGFGAVIPESDQQIACKAYAFPAEKQLHEIIRRRQHQHGKGEKRQIRKEPR